MVESKKSKTRKQKDERVRICPFGAPSVPMTEYSQYFDGNNRNFYSHSGSLMQKIPGRDDPNHFTTSSQQDYGLDSVNWKV